VSVGSVRVLPRLWGQQQRYFGHLDMHNVTRISMCRGGGGISSEVRAEFATREELVGRHETWKLTL
jgi:hypothetical protein